MSSKKTTTQSSGTSAINQTTTPNVPSWISDPAQAMAGTIGTLQAQGPGAFTPTTSNLENQVTNAATNFTPTSDYSNATAAYGGVPNVTAQNVQGQSLLTGLQNYMNPFEDSVVNPVLAQYDYQAGQTTAAQAAAAAQNRAFQGSRYGIQEANTAGQLAMGRASTQGGLLNQEFATATGLSAQDAAARQQAMEANQQAGLTADTANQQAALAKAQGLTGIDTAQNTEQLQKLGMQASLGQRATEEQQIAQQYPLTFAAQNEGLLSGLNPSLYTGSNTTGTGSNTSNSTQTVSDPMGQIANLMAAGGALAGGIMGVPGGGGGIAGLFKGVTAPGQGGEPWMPQSALTGQMTGSNPWGVNG